MRICDLRTLKKVCLPTTAYMADHIYVHHLLLWRELGINIGKSERQPSLTRSKVGAQMFFLVRKSQIRKFLGPTRNRKFANPQISQVCETANFNSANFFWLIRKFIRWGSPQIACSTIIQREWNICFKKFPPFITNLPKSRSQVYLADLRFANLICGPPTSANNARQTTT